MGDCAGKVIPGEGKKRTSRCLHGDHRKRGLDETMLMRSPETLKSALVKINSPQPNASSRGVLHNRHHFYGECVIF
jgi:hypothetical protein